MTILVVDDAHIMRMVLKSILVKNMGIKEDDIFEANDGVEAISIYKLKRPDIVFLDISMPNLDGLGAVKGLLEVNPDIKIIMCTASNDEGDVRECILAGAKDYIVKPPKPDRVVQAVEKITGKRIDSPVSGERVVEYTTRTLTQPEGEKAEVEALKKDIISLKEEVAALKELVEKLIKD